MLKIMKVIANGDLAELEAGLPQGVKTTVEAEKLMKNGDLPAGKYLIIAVHGQFKVTEVKQMEIEKLDFSGMVRA